MVGKAKRSRRGIGEVCIYCKRALESTTSLSRVAATKDHVVPASNGGTRTVWCCRQCNGIKGAMLPARWEKFMAENPEWWTNPAFRHHGRARRGPAPIPPGPPGQWLKDLYRWSRNNSLPLARLFFQL